MPIDDPMIPVAEDGQCKVWVTPCVILGTLADAEGGRDTNFREATDPAFGALS